MEIPEATLAAVKKVVFNIFDNGKVKDVTLRLGYHSDGEEIVCVGLHVFPSDVEAYRGRLIRVPYEVSEVLNEDLKDLDTFVEIHQAI